MKKLDARTIAVLAAMTAMVTIITRVVQVFYPPTGGYLTFADVGVYFAAFAFGPWVGLIAGGVGAALGDVSGGFAAFAPLTFFAHGLQGLAAGYIGGRTNSLPRMLLGWMAGTAIMVALYYLGEAYIMGIGVGGATLEAPGNLIQNIAGALLGIPLVYSVRRAYPPISLVAFGKTWKEI